MHPGTSSPYSNHASFEDESDDEMDWEEILVPSVDPPLENGNQRLELDFGPGPSKKPLLPQGNIEITIKSGKKKEDAAAKKRAEERFMRLTCHKIHTVALLCNALTRNRWMNDELLKARLLSMTPLSLQTSFQMITKHNQPNDAKRGRMFETALMRLTQWWYEQFEIVDYGHIRSQTYDEVHKLLAAGIDDEDDEDAEVIRSPKSLMKHAIMREGSRDISAQLFTSLCRALGIPARLVVSLQSVPWQAKVGKPPPKSKSKGKKKKKAEDVSSEVGNKSADGEDEGDMEEVDITSSIPASSKGKGKMPHFPGSGETLSGASSPRGTPKGKEKALPNPVIKLRKSKPQGRKLGSGSSSISRQSTPAAPVGGYPPVFWTEVFSRPDHQWMPVDPIRYIVNKRKVFEPPPHDKHNRMVYVVAVEEDSYCRDVTPRYAKEYASKTTKVQLGGKGRQEWWGSLMGAVTRPFRLQRDDIEDEEFETHQYREGMPTSVNGFKNHPLYVLEQHLKRDEVISPKTELGKFRGESVYSRSNVVHLKAAENWMREGRKVKEGCQPMKLVKYRAATVHRKRAIELAQQEGDEVLQGLYSGAQTELYIPDPIVDGIIPKNDFGNIDLYAPSMLPAGAAHIPYKGAVKVVKQLGFDYAEAVTSFEFRKGRAIPVTTGIVVAVENEQTILDAYWEHERNAEAKEAEKQRERVIKRWSRLIQGMRIRQRLKDQYEGEPSTSTTATQPHEPASTTLLTLPSIQEDVPGGFIAKADTIIQPFHLPKFEHGAYQPFASTISVPGPALETNGQVGKLHDVEMRGSTGPDSFHNALEYEEVETSTLDEDMVPVDVVARPTRPSGGPRTMLELAQEAAVGTEDDDEGETGGEGGVKASPSLASSNVTPQTATRSTRRTNGIATRGAKSGGKSQTKAKTPRRGKASRLSGEDEELTASESEAHVTDMEDEDEEHDSKPAKPRAVPSKRKRSAPTLPPVVKSDRVLRTRTPKSAKQLEEERDAQAAYRRAIAQ
ncbi:Rad4-domain-containing protein [Schizopora paradoxa]|uniref:Rad4-domain-containing protein n=1 Tax=Schizopora paradoxa TaxID=27342 RepID=A0A0H2RSC7_9AGAM|nr:Rad4-domain-containing protein [Schizopora paradoxa]